MEEQKKWFHLLLVLRTLYEFLGSKNIHLHLYR